MQQEPRVIVAEYATVLLMNTAIPLGLPRRQTYRPLVTNTATMYRRVRFIHANVAWLSGALFLLVLLDAFSYELFFVVSLIGFLVVTELTAPFSITPAWRKRLRWIIGLGLLGFTYVVVKRILEILPPGLF